MLPATYGAQKEVEARQRSRRREAERWRSAEAVRGTQDPRVGDLLCAVVQVMSRSRGVAWLVLGAIRAWYAAHPGLTRNPAEG